MGAARSRRLGAYTLRASAQRARAVSRYAPMPPSQAAPAALDSPLRGSPPFATGLSYAKASRADRIATRSRRAWLRVAPSTRKPSDRATSRPRASRSREARARVAISARRWSARRGGAGRVARDSARPLRAVSKRVSAGADEPSARAPPPQIPAPSAPGRRAIRRSSGRPLAGHPGVGPRSGRELSAGARGEPRQGSDRTRA